MSGLVKYINPIKYINKVSQVIDKMTYSEAEEEEKLKDVFRTAGLDYEGSVSKLKELGKYEAILKNDTMASNHWLIFSALSLPSVPEIKSILEIGTFDGKTTKLLSELFPNAKITTVDLADDDPIFINSYKREKQAQRDKFINDRDSIVKNNDRIEFIQSSSFFLKEHLSEGQKFDLVWVDAAHNFPEVSWDICNGYFRTNKNGYLMCDDVIPTLSGHRDDYASPDSFMALNHLEERIGNKVHYFLKRNSYLWSAKQNKRKYVALVKKP